jgi:ribosomal protein S18 acetylase RimI-like enzyme
MKLRRAENSDIGRITELLYQVHKVHSDGRPDIFRPGAKKYTEGELLEILRDDAKPVYVAENSDGLVEGYAFCLLQEVKDDRSLQDMRTLYIDDLCVDEKCRGHHTGTELYRHVCEEAKRLGCYRVTLNVWELNHTARKFYEAMGLLPLKTTMEKIL